VGSPVWPSPSRSREPLAKTHERQRGTPCSFPFDFRSAGSPTSCAQRTSASCVIPERRTPILLISKGAQRVWARDFCFCYSSLYHCTRCELVPQRVTVGCHPTVTHYCGLHRHMNAWVALHTSHIPIHHFSDDPLAPNSLSTWVWTIGMKPTGFNEQPYDGSHIWDNGIQVLGFHLTMVSARVRVAYSYWTTLCGWAWYRWASPIVIQGLIVPRVSHSIRRSE